MIGIWIEKRKNKDCSPFSPDHEHSTCMDALEWIEGILQIRKKKKVYTRPRIPPSSGGSQNWWFKRKAPDHEHSIFMGALEWVKKIKEGERRES
jgi:hypothetical protein